MWQKLKHEWKTAAWALTALLVEVEVFMDPTVLDPFLDEQYRGLVHISVPIGFLMLRRWKDAHPDPEEAE